MTMDVLRDDVQRALGQTPLHRSDPVSHADELQASSARISARHSEVSSQLTDCAEQLSGTAAGAFRAAVFGLDEGIHQLQQDLVTATSRYRAEASFIAATDAENSRRFANQLDL
ncbi:hypothetical protein [Rhodococcus sp. HNM0569]|uniref:hypothetical protein n=1 Tax=Rhodococcus sp. HNM0569 TaxID=2716340 RepID=UPI00146F0559|nr:hypothetical protein [Rhodococcus sp. HNM0569]NLU84370.1 hypothetical protein [Rhodococcus sp. HNM0569]